MSNKSSLSNKQRQYANFFVPKQAVTSVKVHFFPKNDTKQSQNRILVSKNLVYMKQTGATQNKKCYQNKKFIPFGNTRTLKRT